jgi:hypothetical protein
LQGANVVGENFNSQGIGGEGHSWFSLVACRTIPQRLPPLF